MGLISSLNLRGSCKKTRGKNVYICVTVPVETGLHAAQHSLLWSATHASRQQHLDPANGPHHWGGKCCHQSCSTPTHPEAKWDSAPWQGTLLAPSIQLVWKSRLAHHIRCHLESLCVPRSQCGCSYLSVPRRCHSVAPHAHRGHLMPSGISPIPAAQTALRQQSCPGTTDRISILLPLLIFP